ncbi:MAG TPA: MlaD family protein [Casimicrobiaceae bacterium]|nr:MlaD family protein [Casimicrobiaceae bacterium]
MSAQANNFKLGVFVIGAVAALLLLLLIIGSGRWFQSKTVIETYFNESVQGLDIGSKVKYRGVTVGEVTRINFTYNKYQQDKPAEERLRYVLVEATILGRLIGTKAGGEITRPETVHVEIEKGLRIRLAPQGITGTNYLEIDYVDPKLNPELQISWEPDHVYIPSARSTFTQFFSAAGDVVEKLQRLDLDGVVTRLNRLLETTNERVAAVDTAKISESTTRVLGKVDRKLDQLDVDRISKESTALLGELRQTNQKLATILDDPAWKKLPGDAGAAVAQARKLLEDPNLRQALAHLANTLARLDRVLGGTESDLRKTLDNVRQITDNLRDLTEDAKRNPSRLILGAPPPPAKGIQP